MAVNNEDNREKLADELVDGWDLSTLLGFAKDTLQETWKSCDETFDSDWEYVYEEEDDD